VLITEPLRSKEIVIRASSMAAADIGSSSFNAEALALFAME